MLPDEVLETRRGNTDKVRSMLTALVAKNGKKQIDRQYSQVRTGIRNKPTLPSLPRP